MCEQRFKILELKYVQKQWDMQVLLMVPSIYIIKKTYTVAATTFLNVTGNINYIKTYTITIGQTCEIRLFE